MLPEQPVFLGWDRPPLEVAADWLLKEHASSAAGTVIALPGAGAARALDERLARAGTGRCPLPETLTVGHLPDRLLTLAAPAASRLTRTRAWERALRSLPPPRLERLVAAPPAADDQGAWRRLAEEVRTVFGQLAAECLDFAAVLDGPLAEGFGGERARWEALVAAQAAYEAVLAAAGVCDPHLGRLAAIESGCGGADAPSVVLVGVVEMGGIQRRLLAGRGGVSALVFAPLDLQDAFDELGCVRPAAWLERGWDLDLGRWRVAEGPGGQARLAVDAIARWESRFAPEEITVGVADEEVVPFLEGRLAEHGVFARHGAGTPLGRTAPARLLEAAAALLDGGSFEGLSGLLRHPDLEERLVGGLGDEHAAALAVQPLSELLDRYHDEHLPGERPREWLPCTERGSEKVAPILESVVRALDHLLGPLTGAPRPLAAWAEPVRALLGDVFGARTLDPAVEAERRLAAALAALARAIDEAARVPAAADGDLGAAQAVAMILEEAGGETLPARPLEAGEATIELSGWLELPLDPAPALVVCGFNEGRLPAAVAGDGWLPDGLRRDLGLPDDARRLARDRYLIETLVRSRAEVVFIGARRDAAGDALLPSRLALHGSGGDLVARLTHGLRAERAPTAQASCEPLAHELRPVEGVTLPARWSASAFERYLASPYDFALHRAGLHSLDDRARELDPLGFGIVAHEVLQRFGEGAEASSQDARAVRSFCEAELELVCQERFGPRPHPAVLLQRRQLSWRLGLFATAQARRCAQGWRIEHSEWSPDGVTLDVDGEPIELVGRIDRVDRHADGRRMVIDYKSGEEAKSPAVAHRARDGTWRSLQLPLYAYLAREVLETTAVEPAYFHLGSSAAKVGVAAYKGWSEDLLAEALERARGIVREARGTVAAGEPFAPGAPPLFDLIRAAVFGHGLVGVAALGEDEEEGE
ncbi:MAG: PD-(D/E)XK nuclease family protein [Planctomycetota bacterium]|jgi:RecB family exonuclease|nr:PD-(D/E)XK nuclease family protein [Planctomycetota bacterium]